MQSQDELVRTNIRAEMARRGVTQRDLAEVLGKTQQTISEKLRAGGSAITVAELERISDRLGVETVDLYVDHFGARGEQVPA